MAKPSRVTNVLVPGEQPGAATSPAGTAADAANTNAAPPGGAVDVKQPEGDTGNTDTSTAGAAPAFDLDALRAEIRAEEMAKLQEELAQQLKVASAVVDKNVAAAAPAPRSKNDYRNMRAADVDPATLTAPVLTLDGYVCPLPPEKK